MDRMNNSPLNVSVLAHVFPRDLNDPMGAFLLHLAQALADQGVTMDVVAPHAAGLAFQESLAGTRVHRFRYAPERWERLAYTGTMHQAVAAGLVNKLLFLLLNLAMLWTGLGVIRRTRADVIHAHWWLPGGFLGAVASCLTGRPLVITTHGTDVQMLSRAGWIAPLARWVFGLAKVTTCGSGYLLDQLTARGVLKPGCGRVVPMPVNRLFETFADSAGAAAQPRQRRRGETFTVLTVARLTVQKDIGSLIEAVALLRDSGRAARLIIVGDGPERGALEGRVASLALGSAVEFRGEVPQLDLPDIYASCDVFVLPSIQEGLGLVLAEAQLCGAPVIATSGGGATDIVTDNETGLLTPARDAPALAHALERLCDDPALAARLAANGRTRARQRFTSDAIAAEFLAVYRSVAPTKGT
jgi:glycosyltransferase involved in cell wall biosynthesis